MPRTVAKVGVCVRRRLLAAAARLPWYSGLTEATVATKLLPIVQLDMLHLKAAKRDQHSGKEEQLALPDSSALRLEGCSNGAAEAPEPEEATEGEDSKRKQ